MHNSLFMNHSIQKQNGICGYFGPLTKTHLRYCNRSSMNVRHSSHLTENTSRTLLINLARQRCMFKRFRFPAVSGGSQPALGHNLDGEKMVANFSISAVTGS